MCSNILSLSPLFFSCILFPFPLQLSLSLSISARVCRRPFGPFLLHFVFARDFLVHRWPVFSSVVSVVLIPGFFPSSFSCVCCRDFRTRCSSASERSLLFFAFSLSLCACVCVLKSLSLCFLLVRACVCDRLPSSLCVFLAISLSRVWILRAPFLVLSI